MLAASGEQAVDAGVNIEVERRRIGGGMNELSDATMAELSAPSKIHHQSSGQSASKCRQFAVCRLSHLGQEVERGIRVVIEGLVERGDIEFTKTWGEVVESNVAFKVPAAD